MLHPSEIEKEYEVTGKSVLTPQGWRPIKKIFKTVKMPVYELKTTTHTLLCSREHLVWSDGMWINVRYLSPGDTVDTDTGAEKVISVCDTGRLDHLYDLTVDSKEHSYYSNGIVSHNSTTMAARILITSHLIKRYRSLYVAPQDGQKSTFGDRLIDMESMFRTDVGEQNKYSKKYANGSRVDLAYCLTSANAVRGKTEDVVMLDEAQGMDPCIVPDILYTSTDSDMPMTIYAGTALTIDSLLEKEWQSSSMSIWHVRAKDGKHWLNMYDKDTLHKVCDNPIGPTCPYTGKLLDVTDGCFVPTYTKPLEDGRVGLHVPQCIIPDIAYNHIKWSKIYSNIKHQDFNKILQECFGIAVAEGTREITEQDLMYLCVLHETDEEILNRTRNGYYKLVVSGCDWGGSDYNPATKTKTSYTVHCVLGVAPDGGVDILHYHRYSGMDYKTIARNIVREHNMFNGAVLASDFGVGMAYNMELRDFLPFDRHFIMNYVGPDAEPIKENKKTNMGNQLSINRTEAITNVFKDVKSVIPIIRARDWSISAEYLKDWLNMYRLPVELPNGTKTFKYQRDATRPDDALHAFTFAYVLVKFFLGKSLVEDQALENRMRAVMRNPGQAAMLYAAQQAEITNTDYVVFG